VNARNDFGHDNSTINMCRGYDDDDYYYNNNNFFDPGTQFPGNEKIMLCNTKKYKNQAGMNLTPPPPYYYYYHDHQSLQCFDAVGWVAGRASGL